MLLALAPAALVSAALAGAPAPSAEAHPPEADAPSAPSTDAPTAPSTDAPAAPSNDAPSADAAEPAGPRLRWSVLPNVSYDSDDKFGMGARAQFDLVRAGFEPYRASYVVHLFASTNGFHHHRFRFDLVGLGRAQRLRLTGHLAFRAWLNDGYWGIGNGTTRDAAWEGDFEPDDPARKHYRYSLIQPFSNLTLRAELGGPWLAYASTQLRYTLVRAYEGSLLEEQQPYGMEGGPAVQVSGGILHDTRAPETTPDAGMLLEAGARMVVGTQGPPFGGPFLSARGYVTLAPRLVYAARGMGEYLVGDVPFYEMVHWGGFVPIAGFGGADTLRGISFGRWRAPGKLVLDNELRIDVLTHRALKQDLRWQLVPLGDVGFVFGAGEDATAPAPANPLHPTAGLGVRAIWARTLVGRADVAVGEDVVVDGDTRTPTPSIGVYLAFDHTF